MNKALNVFFFLAVGFSALMPFIAACNRASPVHKPVEVDKTTYERVFLECLKAAKGPNSITAAGNDADEVVSWCRWSAKDIASK